MRKSTFVTGAVTIAAALVLLGTLYGAAAVMFAGLVLVGALMVCVSGEVAEGWDA